MKIRLFPRTKTDTPLPSALDRATEAPELETISPPKAMKLRSKMPLFSRKTFIFLAGFGLIGAVALYFSLAAPLAQQQLLKALSNFTTNKPTLISGTFNSRNKGSPYLSSVSSSFRLALNPKSGNFSLSGQALVTAPSSVVSGPASLVRGPQVNRQPFALEIRNVNYNTYFKISGFRGIPKLVPKGSQLDRYFSPRYSTLNKYDNQWLVLSRKNSGQINPGKYTYQCTGQSLRVTPNDSQTIKSTFINNAPFKIISINNQYNGGVPTTRFVLAPTSPEAINILAGQLSSLSAISNWEACVNDYYASSWANSSIHSLVRDTGQVYVFVTKQNTIRSIQITTSSTKSSSSLVINFQYGHPANVAPVPGAKDGTSLLRYLVTNSPIVTPF